ncbi:hypothetical protein IEQ34_007047 [Dendrobium chrysotoxum]|uniref:Desiccation-related protein PCC13-62 n=1 Tax=Dendrobium chrysotoxum TaxID=161865 RepID=A0AAV7H5T2_DENCH|nr:hypothetical protein IEQ34_007047 [Dendrobium chrysotoxum]
MPSPFPNSAHLSTLLLLLLFTAPSSLSAPSLPSGDVDLLEFPLNLEYLEAEYFLWGALGYGLDIIAPNLSLGGPAPIGVRKANLDPFVRDIVTQFGYQEVGHLKAIKQRVKGFPRPLLDLRAKNFATVIDNALGKALVPPFDPYANGLNYLLASYIIPYVGLTGYVGANPNLQSSVAKRLVAGLLGVEAAQDAVIRTLLYQQLDRKVHPYNISVAEFTDKISILRNKLGGAGIKDEGLVVPPELGAEGKISGNVIAGDEYSIAYARTPQEILRIGYGTGNESKPGGFFPSGADGRIARSYLGKDEY